MGVSARAHPLPHRAFTLVEVLIVVILLGILAAIAVPQIANAAYESKVSAVLQDLRRIRSQIQLYRAQHNDTYPGREFVDQMTKYTNVDGEVSDTRDEEFCLGPYLDRIPPNPISGDERVRVQGGLRRPYRAPRRDRGWWYNFRRGEFRADLSDEWTDSEGVPLNQR